jgi:hypothetical protein
MVKTGVFPEAAGFRASTSRLKDPAGKNANFVTVKT